ncbi:MAG: relaxase MobL [Firmicutes bacterium]|nr:relaxase MobL [Bacillota bacterium]
MSNKVVFKLEYATKEPNANWSDKRKAKHLEKRAWLSGSASYNQFSYFLGEKKIEANKDVMDYYTRGQHTGLFNSDGVISKEQYADIKKRIAKTDSIIWSGLISFDAETSKGFTTEDNAIKFLRQQLNCFLDKTHLKRDNLELFAVLHQDTEHTHIHFSFFEKEARYVDKYGKRQYTTKGSFRKSVIDNFRVNANMFMFEKKDEYYTARDSAIKKLKELRAASSKEFSERQVQKRLLEFAKKLPSGRTAYWALANNKDTKHLIPEVDILANMVIRLNPQAFELHKATLKTLTEREQEFLKVAGANSANLKQLDYIKKLRDDYKGRIGNQVIGLAKDMLNNYNKTSRVIPKDYSKRNKDFGKKLEARKRRKLNTRIFAQTLNFLSQTSKGIQADFIDKHRQIEQQIKYEQLMAQIKLEQSIG